MRTSETCFAFGAARNKFRYSEAIEVPGPGRVNAVAEKLTIFISGTMRDLPSERERVAATIREMGLEPV